VDSNQIIALIKEMRAEHYDRTFAAGPGTTDPAVTENAQRACEFVEEYDRLLARIGAAGPASGQACHRPT
jgi:hypothetical protein